MSGIQQLAERRLTAFRDRAEEFAAAGAQVLAVSMDTLEAQKKFASDIQAPFPLLADPEGVVVEKYGVMGMGFAKRVTFIIPPDGRIAKVLEGAEALDPAGALAACRRH